MMTIYMLTEHAEGRRLGEGGDLGFQIWAHFDIHVFSLSNICS